VEAVALSDHIGDAQLRVLVADAAWSSLEKTAEQLGVVEVLTVPTQCLDDYEAIEPVGCIKIDVEGHEDAVLRGARRIILRDHPSLIIEIEERHKRHSVVTINRFLKELGYKGFFFSCNRLNPIELFRVEEHQDVSNIANRINKADKYVNNFVFFANESLAKVRHLIEGQESTAGDPPRSHDSREEMILHRWILERHRTAFQNRHAGQQVMPCPI
jgi:hypothetical protein